MKNLAVIFMLVVFLTGCGNQKKDDKAFDKLKGNISISGAFGLYPMAQKWAEEFMKENQM